MNELNPYVGLIADKLSLPQKSVFQTLQLLESGATIPFIARYRKEQTQSLDEVAILQIDSQYKKLKELISRKEFILQSILEQGKLSEVLQRKIELCFDPNTLEDLYLPYKKRRKTKADKAREMGLQPLAEAIQQEQSIDLQAEASQYLCDELPQVNEVLKWASYIVAEAVSENEKIRAWTRNYFSKHACLGSEVIEDKKEEAQKYRDYFEYHEAITKAPSHRILAAFRGEAEGLLRLKVRPENEEIIPELIQNKLVLKNLETSVQYKKAISDAYKRLLAPSMENEIRKGIKDQADEEAIAVFAKNLEQLLLQAPLGEKYLIAIDPGYRTGCKLVVLNPNGELLHSTTVFLHPPQNQKEQAYQILTELLQKYPIEAIATGNGTAGKETYDWLQQHFSNHCDIFMVNESGASIYSASEIAREEFPDQDITVRGTVSIGRRLQDPLSELVKIDPKSIGVGQYQHDVNALKLKESLEATLTLCVNKVGVQLNTASKKILSFVAGIGSHLAENIVQFRRENGPFVDRKSLLKVPGMGAKTFEQCAGFLRIKGGSHPLDATAVHPESYSLVQCMAEDLSTTIDALINNKYLRDSIPIHKYVAGNIGLPTLKDILKELDKPGLDIRGKAQPLAFDKRILGIDDISEGMILKGLVSNITNFGAFVDLGIKESGLLHISQISRTFIKHPSEKLSLQQELELKVVGIDRERKRISLSLFLD
jgi:protein Tex